MLSLQITACKQDRHLWQAVANSDTYAIVLYCIVFIMRTSDPYKSGYRTCQGLYRVTVTK